MTLTGPISGGSHGWPFAMAVRDIGALGYIEEEYILEGEATPYELTSGTSYGADGRWHVRAVEGRPFCTRVLVRRPVDPAQFNGCVLVVWANVTAGFEVIEWESTEALNGYAWAFVSAQYVGLHGADDASPSGLVNWDPDRYGSLHISSDDLSYDIFTQAAEAVGPLRPTADDLHLTDPLGGLDVQHIVAVGSSQSAARLATYHNAIQPITEAFDGFLLDVYFGTAAPLGDDPTMRLAPDDHDGAVARNARLLTGIHHLRTDSSAATLVFNTECEALALAPVRQPDDDQLRLWEVAGGSHYSTHTWIDMNAKATRDFGAPFIADVRPGLHVSDLAVQPARDAALHALVEWVRTGGPPPEQPRLDVDLNGGGLVRDAHGIALGGIRLPEVDVPIATYQGTNDQPGLGWLGGSMSPFEPATLHAAYPTRQDYIDRYERSARAASRTGVLLPRDRDTMVERARARDLW